MYARKPALHVLDCVSSDNSQTEEVGEVAPFAAWVGRKSVMFPLAEDVADGVVELVIVFNGFGRVLDESHGELESLFEAGSNAVGEETRRAPIAARGHMKMIVWAIEDVQIITAALVQNDPRQDSTLGGGGGYDPVVCEVKTDVITEVGHSRERLLDWVIVRSHERLLGIFPELRQNRVT